MDVLQALEALDIEERKRRPPQKKKKTPTTATKFVNPLTNRINSNSTKSHNSNSTKSTQREGRPRSLPVADARPGTAKSDLLSPTDTEGAPRSPSASSGRRISFADAPRPPPSTRRLRIPTRSNSLASGFPFDSKLNKYSVSEEEWTDFGNAVIDAANLPKGSNWAWSYHKKDVTKRIKKELQYEGEFKRVINAWNRHFRRKGFQASLELPGPPKGKYEIPDDPEEMKRLENELKRFKMVITPNAEKSGSVYSRSSSLARSVSGEGANLEDKAAAKSEVEGIDDAEEEGKADEGE